MRTSRKQFLQKTSLGIFGMLAVSDLSAIDVISGEPVVMHENEGETYWIGKRNSPLTIRIAKDRQGNKTMSFCAEEIAPGEGIPVHKHLKEDELIFLQEGEGVLTVDNKEVPVKKGSAALIPKGVWHAIKNTGTEKLVMVFSYSPAGFEGYFRELGSPAGTPWNPKTNEEFKRLDKKWGIVYKPD